ncbi:MAG: branched-chain amino acid ABC transporter permease [Hyphomicrobiaceae bacterium]|nr:branched-chain amino acid ABC transporter permease [Hyphomicrobiaceae bacterium]
MRDVPPNPSTSLADRNLAASSSSRRRQLLVALAATALAACVPLGVSDVYAMNVMILTLMYLALSQSWNVLGGYCGQISLGHAIYFGIGAYATVIVYLKGGISPWIGMVVGGVFASWIALALGYFCFRLAGHYYTIATIVIAEAALLLVLNWEWAGAALGLQLPFGPDSWATLQFGRNKLPYFYFVLALSLLTWLIAWWIEGARWGYWWRAVKDDAEAAASLGVSIFDSKMAASAISAFFTAVAGGFYALFVSYIDPQSVFGFQISLLITLPAVLGGIGTLWGPAVGAVLLIPLGELTRSYIGGSGSGTHLIVYGALIVVISLLRPEGLVSLFRSSKPARGAQA